MILRRAFSAFSNGLGAVILALGLQALMMFEKLFPVKRSQRRNASAALRDPPESLGFGFLPSAYRINSSVKGFTPMCQRTTEIQMTSPSDSAI